MSVAPYFLYVCPVLRDLSAGGGGILVHARRREGLAVSTCTERFQHLGGRCLGHREELRYGTDQALSDGSSLDSGADAAQYYDLSLESVYLSHPARQPMPFAARTAALAAAQRGRHRWYGSVFPPIQELQYPVMIGNTIDQMRALEMVEFLSGGGYQLDTNNVIEVGAQMVLYNDQLMVLSLSTLKWESSSGYWQFSIHTQPMKLNK
eukprot:gene18292-21811_t